jgi:hypothetical protein
MSSNKLSAIFVASILAATQMSAQAQSGASAATSAAVGGITSQQWFLQQLPLQPLPLPTAVAVALPHCW